jgi:hypothetical protein
MTDIDDVKQKFQKFNHANFTLSLIELLNLLSNKSLEKNLDDDKLGTNILKSHLKLRSVCNELKEGFTSDETYDEGRIIKKVYKVLTQYVDKLYPEPAMDLFSLKNEEGKTVTIIPGLDINLVAKDFTDDEKKILWSHLYMMYISSVEMISVVNGHKKNKVVYKLLGKMRNKVVEMGVLKKDNFFNPFIGVGSSNDMDDYNVETMYENIENVPLSTGPSMEDVIKLSGVDKLVNIDQLNDQLKNIKDEDITSATQSITKLLGAENDSDIGEVCGTLVQGIVADLKANPNGGIKSMFDTAKSVTEKVGGKLDKDKMKKTAMQLGDFLKNGGENLKNMKDDKGNPIGANIMESLKLPLQLVQSMEKGKSIDPSQYMNLMNSINRTVNKEMKK